MVQKTLLLPTMLVVLIRLMASGEQPIVSGDTVNEGVTFGKTVTVKIVELWQPKLLEASNCTSYSTGIWVRLINV